MCCATTFDKEKEVSKPLKIAIYKNEKEIELYEKKENLTYESMEEYIKKIYRLN